MNQGKNLFSQVKRALTGAVLSIPVGSTVNALLEKDPVEKKDSVVRSETSPRKLCSRTYMAYILVEKILQVGVILPWSRSIVHIAWHGLAGTAVITKVDSLCHKSIKYLVSGIWYQVFSIKYWAAALLAGSAVFTKVDSPCQKSIKY